MPEKFIKSTSSSTICVESTDWSEFELIDSGDGQKLERWGKKTFIRPEPKALWRKSHPELWAPTKIDALCDDNEVWRQSPGNFELKWKGLNDKELTFGLHASQESKHIGLFPEQEPLCLFFDINIVV